MQLYEEGATLRAHAPTSEPAYITDIRERISALEASQQKLQASHKELQGCVQQLELCSLLDTSREVLAGGQLSAEQRKT